MKKLVIMKIEIVLFYFRAIFNLRVCINRLRIFLDFLAMAQILLLLAITICPSAGEVISKRIKKVSNMFKNEHRRNVKVFECGGLFIENIAKSDPLSPSMCEGDNYFSCTSEGGGGCSKRCSSYRLECQECLKSELIAVYEGETGRKCYSCGFEQLAGLNNEKDDKPLWKHFPIQQNGRTFLFKMVCVKSFKTVFMRPKNEGVRVACCSADICMNSKSEFHTP